MVKKKNQNPKKKKIIIFFFYFSSRCCSREFCDQCTSKKSSVPQFNVKEQSKVCEACFKHISSNRSNCFSRLIPYLEPSENDERKYQALIEMHQMISHDEELNFDCHKFGLVPPLLKLLNTNNNEIVSSAVQVISKIACVDEAAKKIQQQENSLINLVSLMKKASNQDNTRILSTKTVSYLTNDKEIHKKLQELGVFLPLMENISGLYSGVELLLFTSKIMVDLLDNNNFKNEFKNSNSLISLLNVLSTAPTPEIKKNCLNCVERLSVDEENKVVIVQSKIMLVILSFLEEDTLRSSTLNILNELVMISDSIVQIVESKGITKITELLKLSEETKLECIQLLIQILIISDSLETNPNDGSYKSQICSEILNYLEIILDCLTSKNSLTQGYSLNLMKHMSSEQGFKVLISAGEETSKITSILNSSTDQHKILALEIIEQLCGGKMIFFYLLFFFFTFYNFIFLDI